jgi:hypothetical protein
MGQINLQTPSWREGENNMEKKNQERVNFLGPMLLIFAGCILLLNVLGIVDWGIWWSILRLWPIFLIAAGLELLLGRRSRAGSFLAALLSMLLLVGALLLTTADMGTAGLVSRQIQQPRDDATEALINIEPAFGVLRLSALPESADLVRGEILLDEGEEVQEAATNQGGQASYRLETTGESWAPFGMWDDRRVWDLGLSPGAALQLDNSIVLGQNRLDLSRLDLSTLNSSMALGWTEVILPAEDHFEGEITGAIGGITLVLPRGTALRLVPGTAMVLRQIPDDFQRQEGVYLSPGYASAENHIDLDIGLAIGLLSVRYAD